MDKKLISKIKEISPSLTKEEKISEIKKILEEKNEPELVIIKDIKEVLTKLADILGVVSNIENQDVKTYEEELQILVKSISELKEELTQKDMVVNIPLDDLARSISRVETAVKSIKFPEIIIPESKEVFFKDDEIIEAIKKIPQFPIEDVKKMFSGIIELLSNKPEFNYERLERKLDGVIKAIGKIDLSVYGGGGNSYLRNAKSDIINPATEETLIDVKTNQENHICTDNTTSTPLGAGEIFTGVWQDCLQYQEVNVSISTDQNSATNGLVIEWSDDADYVCDTDVFTVYANAGTNYTPNPAFRYVRLKYTNGATPQTRFNLMTILRRGVTGGSFHRITDTLKDDSDGRLNLSVLKLRTAANNYVSGSATNSGNFKVSIEELENSVSDNENTQLKTSMYGKTGDTTFQVPRIDPTTHSIQTIDYAHKEIHTGSHYYICDYVNPIQTGVTFDFAVTTANTTAWSHAVFWFASTLGASLEVYEGCSSVVGGTPVTAINNNRNSTNTSGMTILQAPSSITLGTKISGYLAGANRVAGATSREAEVILKQNTTYLFRFTSLANSNAISFCAEWYEHQNKTV